MQFEDQINQQWMRIQTKNCFLFFLRSLNNPTAWLCLILDGFEGCLSPHLHRWQHLLKCPSSYGNGKDYSNEVSDQKGPHDAEWHIPWVNSWRKPWVPKWNLATHWHGHCAIIAFQKRSLSVCAWICRALVSCHAIHRSLSVSLSLSLSQLKRTSMIIVVIIVNNRDNRDKYLDLIRESCSNWVLRVQVTIWHTLTSWYLWTKRRVTQNQSWKKNNSAYTPRGPVKQDVEHCAMSINHSLQSPKYIILSMLLCLKFLELANKKKVTPKCFILTVTFRVRNSPLTNLEVVVYVKDFSDNSWWTESGDHQLRLVYFPIIYRVLAPSQVWLGLRFLNHQQ